MLVFESLRQPTRFTKIDVENSAALITVEMVVRRDVPVVALGADGTRHLIDKAIGDEYLEIAIDGSERKRSGVRQECPVNLRCRRMRIALSDPMKNRLSLARAIAAWSDRGVRGGCFHFERIGFSSQPQQPESRIIPTLWKSRPRLYSHFTGLEREQAPQAACPR